MDRIKNQWQGSTDERTFPGQDIRFRLERTLYIAGIAFCSEAGMNKRVIWQ